MYFIKLDFQNILTFENMRFLEIFRIVVEKEGRFLIRCYKMHKNHLWKSRKHNYRTYFIASDFRDFFPFTMGNLRFGKYPNMLIKIERHFQTQRCKLHMNQLQKLKNIHNPNFAVCVAIRTIFYKKKRFE